MKNKVVDILTSYDIPRKVCAMGNEAVARGALEAGVNGVFSYPGTPSTEISEVFNFVNNFQTNPVNQQRHPDLCVNQVYFEYSINEKIALEKAIAYSIGNKSALCIMKNVGMNVASDALMSITYQTIVAPVVIVLCDDPGCHSSSNEQDSRHWGAMASVPVFNPATPEDAHRMMKDAFALSDSLKLPVIVRLTTRVSHTRSILNYGSIERNDREAHFDRLPNHINIPARTATAHQKLLDKLQSDIIAPFFAANTNTYGNNEAKSGIIGSGVAIVYMHEILNRDVSETLHHGMSEESHGETSETLRGDINSTSNHDNHDDQANNDRNIAILELGLIHPFPENEVLAFLKRGFDTILILEELDPIIENAVRTIAQKNGIKVEILGKGFAGLTPTGEFSLHQVREAISEFMGVPARHPEALPDINNIIKGLPPRPPALCAGCPHRATFYALKLCVPREQSQLVMCGDIGCFGLGALPPLKMIDTINHMGMSVSMAQGLSEAFSNQSGNSGSGRKTVAMLGDGTFFHSGVASLLNAVYTRANVLVIIFDNRTIGMTGRQDHPGANQRKKKYNEIQIEPLVKGMGIPVQTISPFDLRDTFKKINKAMLADGVQVIISKAPCIFLPDFMDSRPKSKIIVDKNKCNTCGNHSDLHISCSKRQSPLISLSRARAKIEADVTINADRQLCPANICNHGFFNSILEGDYKTAVDIVRDKMLFARTCGDICHRPCELFASEGNGEVVPIKQLKKYVTSMTEYTLDFTNAFNRVDESEPNGKEVAVIGGGPAGLSAAYDLIQQGYGVTLFERESKVGGLVRFAIPKFRMHKTDFNFEANMLKELGVKFELEKTLGQDIFLDQLSKEYDAVLINIGMNKPKVLDLIDNCIPFERRMNALDFLKSYNTNSVEISDGSTILVIGGGNSAIDAARAVIDLNRNNRVILSCVETKADMPAFDEEIVHAIEEGVAMLPDSYVSSCSANGRLQFDLNTFSSKAALQRIEADYVIVAIGQDVETTALNSIKLDSDNRIVADVKTGKTSAKNVFVAGDLCSGNHMSVIGAIASGKKAATGIRQLLEGYQYGYEGAEALHMLNTEQPKGHLTMKVEMSENLLEEIKHFNLFQACQKCNHCIDNFGCPALIKVNGKIEIDDPKCTLCGLCIDVCPNGAIQWERERGELLLEG